jgi:phage terminase large subunit-like protein
MAAVRKRDYCAMAKQYEDDVIAGVVPACKWVRLACERNRRDRGRERTDLFPYYFDAAAARRRCAQAELFPHIKGPKAKMVGRDADGRPRWATIELEPHQAWFIANLFGWRRVADGLRRFRIAHYWVPRKNAKSTLAAVISLLMLVDDGESGAECYSAATTRDQAKVVAEIVWEMASRLPEFREYFGVKLGAQTQRSLQVPATAGKFAPLSADAGTLDALNISFAVIDELHAHRTRAVYDVIDTATGARLQPLLLITSTAGVDIGGIAYEKLQYLQAVLEGTFEDEQLFGIYYTIDEGDDWRSPEAHRKANPNYGVSVDPDDLARKVREAERSPAGVNNFLTKHLNVWVRAESTWMPMEEWRACGSSELRLEDFAGVPCYIGVDLAETRDIMAKVREFRITPDAHPELFYRLAMLVKHPAPGSVTAFYVVFGTYYLPEETVERSPVAQVPGWVRDEKLVQTDGNVADYGRLERDILEDCDELEVREICFDRAMAAAVMQSLQRQLGDDPPVVVIKQSVEVMDPAMKAVERQVLGRTLLHDNNPVLTWMVSNVVVERNYKDEIFPRKAGGKDSHNKIDGAIALFNATSRAYEPATGGESAYADGHGLMVV